MLHHFPKIAAYLNGSMEGCADNQEASSGLDGKLNAIRVIEKCMAVIVIAQASVKNGLGKVKATLQMET